MSLLNFSSENFNEVVFENRNKDYGAYEIRTTYVSRMFKSQFFALLFLTSLALVPYVVSRFSKSAQPKVHDDPGPNQADSVFAIPRTRETEMVLPPEKHHNSPAPKTNTTTPGTIASDTETKDNTTKSNDNNTQRDKDNDGTNTTDKNTGTLPGPAVADTNGNYLKDKTFNSFDADAPPEFPGGENALLSYLSKHLHYPEAAVQQSISGTVIVSFVIDQNGLVTAVSPAKRLGGGCTEEAMDVVSALPKWKPGIFRGHPVKVRVNLPVKFKLNG